MNFSHSNLAKIYLDDIKVFKIIFLKFLKMLFRTLNSYKDKFNNEVTQFEESLKIEY